MIEKVRKEGRKDQRREGTGVRTKRGEEAGNVKGG